MENKQSSATQKLKKGIHWTALALVIYIFGYAGLYKIIGVPGMMENMAARGFGKSWTLFIGLAEVLGVIGLIGGVFYRPLKIMSLLFLWPFAIGALTSHMSTHDPFSLYLNALLVCIMPAVILWTDEKFKLVIR